MFQNTLDIVDAARISLLHVFPFSPRSGTVAGTMIQLPRHVILERAKILRAKAASAKIKLFESMIGGTFSGIVEKSGETLAYGKTDSFVPFEISTDSLNTGTVLHNLKISGFSDNSLIATV
jgi:threonylcarbamoyladenosine tRNA methylthiotransferase MtaB